MTTYSRMRTRTSTAKVGEPIVADTAQLRRLASALKTAAPASRKEMNRSLRAAAEIVAADAKSRAAWSSRIPKSIRVQGGARRLRVVAGGPGAPQAVGYEVGSQGQASGKFRHPVFSSIDAVSSANINRGIHSLGRKAPIAGLARNRRAQRGGPVYVTVATRPYLLPAWEAHRGEVLDLVATAVEAATNALLKEV